MPQVIDDKHLKICEGLVVWDEMNNPSVNDGGNTRRGLKIVLNPNSPDIALIENMSNAELQQGEFKGTLPNGGLMPLGIVGPNEYNGQYNGWRIINCTTFRMPDVYEQGQRLNDHMQYLPKVFSGQIVDVVVHFKTYNNKSRGVAARLDGFEIRTELNAPPQYFGGSTVDTSTAFGGGYQQPNQNNNGGGGGYQQPNQQPNQNNNGGGGGYQQPNQQPNQNNNGGGGYQQSNQQPNQNNNGGQPQQAHDFLPNGQ